MAMRMTGRVLLVCALCVLWCGVAVVVLADEPGGDVVPGVVTLGSLPKKITDDGQLENKDAKGKEGERNDKINGEQLLKKENHDELLPKQDTQTLEGEEKAAREPAGRSSEEGEINGDLDVEEEITVVEDKATNEDEGNRGQEESEFALEKGALSVNLTDNQQKTSGTLAGNLQGKNQKKGEKEEEGNGKQKEREQHDQHQEENERKLQEQENMQQQEQKQKPRQDQEGEHTAENQKDSTKEKKTVGTADTANTHNSDSSTGVSHTTSPLLLFLVVACAAAAAVLAA
ncbi:mucin-associated surface protein (MASP), putative [Trypanosoma cruzi marinkellei]|uniref:Mucin-associated surface protein (MASP), putative n=1 Tax=Trypanosoma cruzi marinkellei TaxID=85056 RepID=K2NTE7_TRYCR|nr:mucin-associated surface protein (MASP), putative [Trypanosoma cruzi marinkellei]